MTSKKKKETKIESAKKSKPKKQSRKRSDLLQYDEDSARSIFSADSKSLKILRERASELAAEPEREDTNQDLIEVVEFILAYERYGLETRYVREVYPLKDLTSIPCTPPFVMGITNIRGQIISIVNLKQFFDLPHKGLTDLNRVIVLRAPGMDLGILADRITGVRQILKDNIQTNLPTLTDMRAKYLYGVTADRLAVLDVEKIIHDPKLIVHEEVEL